MTDTEIDRPRYPIELRDAKLAGVNYTQRIIEVVAVPWEQETVAVYRGQIWREVFQRGAFDGLEKRPNRVRVNRDHDSTRTVGKMVAAHPSAREGLIAELRIAQTPLGDETLALADEDCLSPSVGFAAGGAGQQLIRNPATRAPQSRAMELVEPSHRDKLPLRRIVKAFLEHIGLVPDQSYDNAGVVAVRSADTPDYSLAAHLPPSLPTPSLDEWYGYLEARRAKVRC